MEPDRVQIVIELTRAERAALEILAFYQRRDPTDQAAVLIHDALVGYGLLIWRPLTFKPLDTEDPEDET